MKLLRYSLNATKCDIILNMEAAENLISGYANEWDSQGCATKSQRVVLERNIVSDLLPADILRGWKSLEIDIPRPGVSVIKDFVGVSLPKLFTCQGIRLSIWTTQIIGLRDILYNRIGGGEFNCPQLTGDPLDG